MERHFTRPEAEALLPELEPLLRELADSALRLDRLNSRLAAIPVVDRTNGHAAATAALTTEIAAVTARIRELITRVAAYGVEIKDPRTGLIDFRAHRDDRIVYLCWRLGEPRILFWHELDAGFAGRQPLD